MIKSILVLIFIISVAFLINILSTPSGYSHRLTYPGCAIAFGLIAGISIWSFIYFECNYRKPKD
jgi:hypothetical protein